MQEIKDALIEGMMEQCRHCGSESSDEELKDALEREIYKYIWPKLAPVIQDLKLNGSLFK